jgi:hypothetical protein
MRPILSEVPIYGVQALRRPDNFADNCIIAKVDKPASMRLFSNSSIPAASTNHNAQPRK